MLYIILTLIVFAALCIVEAKLESIEIELKAQAGAIQNYPALNAAEHRWSAIYYTAVVGTYILVSIIQTFNWRFVPLTICLILIRRIFFEYGLKIIRKRPIKTIEGDQVLDTAVRKALGVNGGYVELAILFAALAGFIFITIKI